MPRATDNDEATAGLQVDQDLAYQRRQWVAERVGWALMLLIVLAALAGLLGPGPLNDAEAGQPGDPLYVQYHRFPRHASPGQLMKLHLGPQATAGGDVRVWVGREYLDGFRVEKVVPEPERVEAGPDRLVYVFRLHEPGKGVVVRFLMEPDAFGRQHARVGLVGGPELSFGQFVYP